MVNHAERIAIVGAGLGGTAAAALLQRAGFKVDVYD
jgi:6-hydroxynicotinate 3-monooxygenase